MGDKPFSWHQEYYDRALKQIAGTAGKQYSYFLSENDEPEIGWLEYLIREHPEQYKKYEKAMVTINALWGDMDPKAMEEFKKAVKVEVDGTKWAIDKYLEWQGKQAEAERMKGTQEVLAACR